MSPYDPIVAANAFRMDVPFGEAAIVERTAPMGAFVPAQDRAECPLPGQANPPNKGRQGREATFAAAPLNV